MVRKNLRGTRKPCTDSLTLETTVLSNLCPLDIYEFCTGSLAKWVIGSSVKEDNEQ